MLEAAIEEEDSSEFFEVTKTCFRLLPDPPPDAGLTTTVVEDTFTELLGLELDETMVGGEDL